MFLTDEYRCDPPTGAGYFSGCRFDVSVFQPQLFAEMGIPRPPAIVASVPKRQAEFLAGRHLARGALHHMGAPLLDVGIGPQRQPLWPAGYHGSITHSDGVALVVLARQSGMLVGVDLEKVMPVDVATAVAPQVLSATEVRCLGIARDMDPGLLTLVFSAKETLFKALFPVVGRFFDFSAAELGAAPTSCTVSLVLTQDLSPEAVAGQRFEIGWTHHHGQVLTWLVVRQTDI